MKKKILNFVLIATMIGTMAAGCSSSKVPVVVIPRKWILLK